MTGLTGFMLLYRISVPFNKIRGVLFFTLLTLFLIGITFMRKLFSLVILTPKLLIIVSILFLIAILVFNFFTKLFYIISKKIRW